MTALMKAAVQGRRDCVTALLLAGERFPLPPPGDFRGFWLRRSGWDDFSLRDAVLTLSPGSTGADLQAVDAVKGKTAREWANFTGRFETTVRIRSLLRRPRAEQFGIQFQPEWPALAELVAKALSPKSRSRRLLEKIRSIFTFNIPRDPEEGGVLDHMVTVTTSLASPFVSTACQTICPESPPELGKARLSVPEILGHHSPDPDGESRISSRPSTAGSSCNGQAVSEVRLLPPRPPPSRLLRLVPLWLRRGNSIFPGEPVPKIKVNKASGSPAGEKKPRVKDKHLLKPPEWRYKTLKEEKKAAKEGKGGEKEKKKKKKKKG